MSERVKLADARLLTSLSDTDNMLLESGGSMRKAALSTFTDKIMGDMNADMIMENVAIGYTLTNGTYKVWASLADWPALQDSGAEAFGVVLAFPGKLLLIAPTDSNATLPVASSRKNVNEGLSSRALAYRDLDGEARCEALLAAQDDSFICGTADYAVGFCNQYERIDSRGYGVAAGNWWLPSLGELMMILANRTRVNYALSLIDGATQLGTRSLWSCTEVGTTNTGSAWFLQIRNNVVGFSSFTTDTQAYARPVSAFGK